MRFRKSRDFIIIFEHFRRIFSKIFIANRCLIITLMDIFLGGDPDGVLRGRSGGRWGERLLWRKKNGGGRWGHGGGMNRSDVCSRHVEQWWAPYSVDRRLLRLWTSISALMRCSPIADPVLITDCDIIASRERAEAVSIRLSIDRLASHIAMSLKLQSYCNISDKTTPANTFK